MIEIKERLKKSEWKVKSCSLKEAQDLVKKYHYARGGSNTAVYTHGLYTASDNVLVGVVWWLPPTRVACESVNKENWKKVLSLTRMVMAPGTPKNACSFLLSRSIKIIKKDGRFISLVTYADEAQQHKGIVYKASNWEYVGKTGPYVKWVNKDGVQVSQKSTVNRTKSKMEELGHIKVGSYYKHKYVMHLCKRNGD